MDTAPKEVKDYIRPKVFCYHKHAVSGLPYGVLHYTSELPGPDTKNLQIGKRHDVTDNDWSEFCGLVMKGEPVTLIGFLKNRYPPPVDKADIVLTVANVIAKEEMHSQSTTEVSTS